MENLCEDLISAWNSQEREEFLREWEDDTLVIDNISDICESWPTEERDEFIREWNNDEALLQVGCGEKRSRQEDEDDVEVSDNFFTVTDIKQIKMTMFNTTGTDYTIRFKQQFSNLELVQYHHRLHEIFQNILDVATAGVAPRDMVRFVLRSSHLEYPISIPFIPCYKLTTERVLSEIERVIQSNHDFRLDDSVYVNLIHVAMPVGSGGKRRIEIDLEKHLKSKRSIVRIQNKDELCLARALVVCIAKIENDTRYRQITNSQRPLQTRLAEELHEEAGVVKGPCGLDEAKQFQAYLVDYQINIVSKEHENSIIYSGPEKEKKMYVYFHNHHYDVITSMPAFFARKKYCHDCKKGYDKVIDHMCPSACKSCRFPNCPSICTTPCDDCGRLFKSQACFDRHKQIVESGKSLCELLVKCPLCKTIIKRNKLLPELHHCGQTHCTICDEYAYPDHRCYMQPVKPSNDESTTPVYNQLLFFDFECRQENGKHEANFCVVQDEAGHEWVFKGENTKNEFCQWLFKKEHANCIVVAHNFQGYDSYFILQYLRENGIEPEVIMRGAKVLTLSIPILNIKFIDSLSFIPMRLADFPKTFGLTELTKGYFPHHFNIKENENYIGQLPDPHYYDPEGMSPDGKEKFYVWHRSLIERNYVFDFQQEILNYCRSDVDILRRCCMEFRELFRDVTDIDPFEKCLTIASACNLVFRTNFLKEDTIAVIPPHGYRPKDKHSLLALKWLSYTSEKNDIRMQHARNGGEKRVGNYLLDGYDEETNTAYEVQGCFWHGCAKCYARDTVNVVNGKTMHDLNQATVEKRQFLEREGLRVVEVWECEIKRDLERDGDMKNYFDAYGVVDPLEPRDAFFGGRTNAAKLFHQCQNDEKIRYVDFTSLYPWCNKMTRTVVGHPEIITENFGDVSNYFGLVKCTVLPPRGLFHPVLPYRTQGKLMFPLCKTCADTCNQSPCDHDDSKRAICGTWCTVELDKAVEKGYTLLKMHEVWHFSQQSDELFKDYVDTFLKIKQESSGYPKDCIMDEQKERYVEEYLAKEGIQLDPGKIVHNPGMRALSKLMLNSFWGKFAQRPNMSKTELIRNPQKFYDYLSSDEISVLDANLVGEDVIEIRYQHTENFIMPNSKTNVVIAAFTTAYARLKLYDVLDSLQERALYYDTDSVVFLSKSGDPEPPLGPYLGDLTDELKGEYIKTFISGGPKNYCYRTNRNKVETKIRGITLNCLALEKVNIDVIHELVNLHAVEKETRHVTVEIPYKITRDTKTKNIETKRMKKDYRIVYNKRVIIDDYKTLPYGY